MLKILIVEDDKIKIERLKEFFIDDQIIFKESLHGGLLELKKNYKNYDFLILDMTIPLWEKGHNDIGGNYEQFGGEKVLREMQRRRLFLPTILFTMFDTFPTKNTSITFDQLNEKYLLDFNSFFQGAVFYNSNEDNWKSEMLNLINKTRKK